MQKPTSPKGVDTVDHSAGPAAFPQRRGDIECLDRRIGGRHAVVLHDRRTGKFFHLGSEEAAAFSRMDGTATVDAITRAMEQAGYQWTVEDVQALTMSLVKQKLVRLVDSKGNEVKSTDDGIAPSAAGRSQQTPALKKLAVPLSRLISQRIAIMNADHIAISVCRHFGWVFSRRGVCAAAILAACAVAVVLLNLKSLADESRSMLAPAAWPLMVLIWFLLKIIHEAGHAVSAKRQGVRVGDAGIMFFMFAPLAYVDVTDAWRLRSSWARVQIALGGVYFEAWTAIAAAFMYPLLPDGLARHIAAQWMIIAGPASWLVNANPLLRLDGYYALSDLLNIPNLRMHGRAHWLAIIERYFLGIPAPQRLLTGWRSSAATVHAAASIVFQLVWMSGLVFAVSKWAGALGMVLAGSAALLWGLLPLAGWLGRHWHASGEAAHYRRRLILVVAAACVLLSLILNVSSPFVRGVPVIVQYCDEQIGRAAANGFVDRVAVQAGQRVKEGDVLLEIRNDDLLLRRAQMSDDLTLALSKHRQLSRKKELAAAEAQLELVRSYKASLEELDQAVNDLRITAVRGGVVVSERPEQWLGRYVRRGDILIRIADMDDKELLIVFPEAEWASYAQAVATNRALTARLRGGQRITVQPQPAQPRFRDILSHPAMAGCSGGDIAVIADADAPGGFRSLQALGEAIASLSAGDSPLVHSGQRGRLYLRDTQSILVRLWNYLSGN
jgi:putative peptide zinc metalloprotease protein